MKAAYSKAKIRVYNGTDGLFINGTIANYSDEEIEDAAEIAETSASIVTVAFAVGYGISFGECSFQSDVMYNYSQILLVLSIYFWIVVYSFFCELQEEGGGGGHGMAMGSEA